MLLGVDHRRQHQLLRAGALGEVEQARANLVGTADHGGAGDRLDRGLLLGGELVLGGLLWRREPARAALAQAGEREARGAGQVAGLVVVGGADRRAGDHPVGLVEPLRRLERLAVDLHRRDRVPRAEVVGEGEGQSQRAGRLSAVVAGAEQPDLGSHPLAGRRGDVAVGVVLWIEGLVEEPEQLAERLGEVLDRERVGAPPERGCGDLVGARCAPDPEIDAARMEPYERPELLGDDERRVVRQHHAARPDPDRGGRGGQLGGQHRRRRAGDPGHVVVLGDPVAVISEALDVPHELDGVPQGLAGLGALGDDGEIEDREGQRRLGAHACESRRARRPRPMP